MELKGVLRINAEPPAVRAALRDPAILGAMLPGTASVSVVPGSRDSYDFVLHKKLGPLELSQRGTLTLQDLPENQMAMTAKSSHLLAGKATLAMVVTLIPARIGTRVIFDGTVEASGLIGKLMGERANQVQAVIARSFEALKAQIEPAPSE